MAGGDDHGSADRRSQGQGLRRAPRWGAAGGGGLPARGSVAGLGAGAAARPDRGPGCRYRPRRPPRTGGCGRGQVFVSRFLPGGPPRAAEAVARGGRGGGQGARGHARLAPAPRCGQRGGADGDDPRRRRRPGRDATVGGRPGARPLAASCWSGPTQPDGTTDRAWSTAISGPERSWWTVAGWGSSTGTRPGRTSPSSTSRPWRPRRAAAVAVPDGLDRQVLADAALAWEVATCWVPEPDYARRCLRRLREP